MSDWNIELRQGSTWTIAVEYLDPDGVAIDLTGALIRMQIRTTYADQSGGVAPLADLAIGTGITVTSAVGGTFTVAVSDTLTQAMPPGNWVYDLEVESAGGEVTTLMYGRAMVRAEVTR